MIVTTVDFYANMDKYLAMVNREDVLITLDGKPIAKMIKPQAGAVDSLRGLLKNAPPGITAKSIREERLRSYEDHV